ncbi:MAG: hypothetical protein IKJ83_00555 [Ruminococcus sp.]|nr:hypothetical protein [Ruminococcus sp.]
MELKLLRNKKTRHPLRYIVLGAVFVVFVFSTLIIITSNNKQIKSKTRELNAIKNELQIQQMENSKVEIISNYSDEEYLEYVIQKAHNELDYVKQGERVFIITAGN